jgi:HK97 family phage portal protein
LFESLGIGRSDAGVMINEKQALRITTAQTCVRIISEDLASTSHEIFKVLPDGTTILAPKHPLWPLLHDQPNDRMSAIVFWTAFLAGALGWGNSYAYIKRDKGGRPVALIPLDSSRTAPMKVTGNLVYGTTQTVSGEVMYFDPDEILHLRGLSFDGISGISPIATCKNAFGLAMAAEKFGALLFGQGARASGVLTHPGTLNAEAYENLKKSLRERTSGENSLMPLILEEGMAWQQLTINPNDAQFLATRQFQKEEIAQLYRVPMHLLQSLLRATNNNIEHQGLDYVRYCLRPWAVRIEEEVYLKLLGGQYRMLHNLDDLRRGDFASITAGLQMLRNNGIYSTNDCLRVLRENPITTEEGGDLRIVQGAMINMTSLLAGPEDEEAPAREGEGTPVLARSSRIAPTFRTMARRAISRAIRHAGDKDVAREALRPVLLAMAQAILCLETGAGELSDDALEIVEQELESAIAESHGWTAGLASQLSDQIGRHLTDRLLEPSRNGH